MKIGVQLIVLSVILSTRLVGQEARIPATDRTDRIVVASPHFDESPPTVTGLNCPGSPLHLVGFESAASAQELGSLTVRTLRHPNARRDPFDFALPGVSIRILRFHGAPIAGSLPLRLPWIAMTDSLGLARISAPPGVYEIQFQGVGYRHGIGVIRIRSAESDSLHAFLDTAAIC